MSLELVVDHSAEVKAEALTWPERAKAVHIVSDVTYTAAGELLMGIKALRDRIAETFDPHIKRAHDAHKALVKEKRDAEDPLVEAETIIKRALGAYNAEQERLRQAEQQRLQALAQKEEEDRRIAAAAALETEGNATGNQDLLYEAMELVEQPVVAAPVYVPPSTPKVSGISHRDNWSARVTSVSSLIKFVAAHPEHQNLLLPNQTALNAMARAMKANMKIDGVQAFNAPIVAAGRR